MGFIRFILWLIVFIASFIIFAVLYYTLQNRSGHTGFPLHYLYYFYVIIFFIGFLPLVLLIKKNRMLIKVSVLAITSSIFGLFLPVYLEKFELLMEYEKWLKNGFGEQTDSSMFYIGAYATVFVISQIISASIIKVK